MKKLIFFGMLGLLISSCTQSFEDVTYPQSSSREKVTDSKIDQNEAVAIAHQALAGLSVTRSSHAEPKVEYIVRSSRTRSNVSDTIAYVVNYPENSGFAIVSTDRRFETLLAYSDEGNIDIKDEQTQAEVILPIEQYMNEDAGLGDIPVNPNPGLDFAYDVIEWCAPKVIIKLTQEDPWNAKVVEEKGECYLAGCVPVAVATIMSHCKSSLTFEGIYYNFSEITKCIAIHQGASGLGSTNYSYSLAVAKMGQLLWDIGQKLGATYSPGSTGASTKDGYYLLSSLG